MRKKGNLQSAMILGLMAGLARDPNVWGSPPRVIIKQPKAKKCLLCKKEHFHHNSFCSVDCCRKWRDA